MKTKFIKPLLCRIFINSFIISVSFAQINPLVGGGAPPPPGPISGPTSVVMPTVSSQYSVPAILPGITLHWSFSPVTAGTISSSINQATVTWNSSFSGTAQVACTASNSSGTSAPSTLAVTVTATPLIAGALSPASQTISYNTAPSTITGSASGGTGVYSYQWQSSPGNVTWTNISGATSRSYTPGVLTATTAYRLLITSGVSSVASSIATVFVNQAIIHNFTYTADSLFQHLNKTPITTNVLYDRAFPLACVHLLNVNEPDTINHNFFLEAYAEMYSSAYNQTGWVPVDTIKNRASICRQQISKNNVPVGLAFYNYNVIDVNALANNLIQMHSDSLYYDTPNRTSSPYDVKNTFVASPLLDSVNAQNALQFVFQANLFMNKSSLTLTSLQVDFGDGRGLVSVSLGSSYDVTYSAPDGYRNLKFVATMSNGNVYTTYGQLKVYGTGGGNNADAITKLAAAQTCSLTSTPYYFQSVGTFQGYDENYASPGYGLLQINYATSGACDGVLRKPIIICQQFIPGGLTNDQLYGQFKNMFKFLKLDFLRK